MGMTMGIPEELLQQYQQLAQQKIIASVAQSPYQGIGLLGGAFGAYSTGTAQGWMAQQDVSVFRQAYQPIGQSLTQPLYPMGKSDYNMKIRFNRINEVVEIDKMSIENNRFIEPLDELRIKVAEWLYN